MSKKKKNRNQDKRLATIILIAAILELVDTLMEIIKKLIE